MVQVRWLIRRRPATARDGQISPEKRKVGSSTLPLTTISQLCWQPASSAFSLFSRCFRLYFSRSAVVCRGVPSCLWGTRGGAPEPGLVGFLWGVRRPSAGHAVGRSETSARRLGQVCSPTRVAGRQLRPGLTGLLPCPAGPGASWWATSGDLDLATHGDFSWPRTALIRQARWQARIVARRRRDWVSAAVAVPAGAAWPPATRSVQGFCGLPAPRYKVSGMTGGISQA